MRCQAWSGAPEPAEAGPALQHQPASLATPSLSPLLLPLVDYKQGKPVSWSNFRSGRCLRPPRAGRRRRGGAERSSWFLSPLSLVVPLPPTCSQCKLSSSPYYFRCSHSPEPLATSLHLFLVSLPSTPPTPHFWQTASSSDLLTVPTACPHPAPLALTIPEYFFSCTILSPSFFEHL